jgi:hypothetical protein
MYRLPAGYESARVHVLVTLHWGASPIRVATDAVDVTDAVTGEVYAYAPGVGAVDLEQAAALAGGGDAQGTSVPLEIVLPVDVPAVMASATPLAGALCEVALWAEGSDYGERKVVVLGLVADPEYGEEWEPVRFSVESQAWDDQTLIPGPDLIVTGTNWVNVATLIPEYLGLPYPIIIGSPGMVSTDTVAPRGWIAAARGVWAEYDTGSTAGHNTYGVVCLLAGHHVDASRVYITTPETFTQGVRVRVRNSYDRAGHPIAWLSWYEDWSGTDPGDEFTYNAATTYSWFTGPESDGEYTYGLGSNVINGIYLVDDAQPVLYIAVYDPIDGATGMQWRGRALRGAGDVIEWALSQTTTMVDHARFASAAERLNQYKIDAFIDARVNPWEWLNSNVLPLLPVSLVSGPAGVYPVVWRLDARPDHAEIIIDADADASVSRASGVRCDTGGIVNRFTLRYAYDLMKGKYCATARVSPGPLTSDDLASTVDIVHPLCSRSQATYRTAVGRPLVAEQEITSTVIYDNATALAVLAWMPAAYAMARETVTYSVPATTYGHRVEVGSVALLTDSRMSFAGRVALVTAVTDRADGYTDLDLWIRPEVA